MKSEIKPRQTGGMWLHTKTPSTSDVCIGLFSQQAFWLVMKRRAAFELVIGDDGSVPNMDV